LNQNAFEVCLDVWRVSDGNKPIWEDLAKRFGYENPERLRSEFKRERQRKNIRSKEEANELYGTKQVNQKSSVEEIKESNIPDYEEKTDIHPDGSITTDKLIWMSDVESKTPEFLLKAHGYLPSAWILQQAQSTLWHGLQKGGVNRTLLYRSKITAKPRITPILDEESVNKIFERLEAKNFQAVPVKQKRFSKNGKALLLPISDLHLGLLSTEKVCGNEYNLEIAENLFFESITETLNKIDNWNFESIYFVIGNDFLNSDNLSGTTSHGTPQDNVDFWYALVDKAIEMIIRAVDMLREISNVEVVYVNSNHDEHSLYCVMKAVELYYRNIKNVKVDTSPLVRKYINWNRNLICFSHDMNVKRALEIVSVEAKDYWTQANQCYVFLGHLHQAMQYETQGALEIYRLPTISGNSRWANGKGFLQTKKMNQAFILDAENGIETVMNVVVGKSL
jgi:hypothetical protein